MSRGQYTSREYRRVADERDGEGWLANLPQGARYALAIGANVAFFGVVGAAVFWFFQLGASSRTEEEASAFAERARAERTVARADISSANTPPLPIERAPRNRNTSNEDAGTEPSARDIERRSNAAEAEDAAAPASADPRARASIAEDEAEPDADPIEVTRASNLSSDPPEGADDDETAPADDEPDASDETRDIAQLWADAGQLAARLEAEYPCAEFALRSRSGGFPFIEGEAPTRADVNRIEPQVEAVIGDDYEIDVGLGCTVDLGGGYIALGNEDGAPRLMEGGEVSGMARAVLPEADMCAALGHVVDAQPRLRERLEVDDEPAVWVAEAAALRLCRAEDDAWRVRVPDGSEARAGAILYRGDILVAEAVRGAGAGGGAAESPDALEITVASNEVSEDVAEPPARSSSDAAAPAPAGFRLAPESPDSMTEARNVRPVSGPSAEPPADMGMLPANVTVTVEFVVRSNGRPEEIMVAEATTYSAPVIAAAVQSVQNSRFPAPEPNDRGSYRGRYEVHFDRAGETGDAAASADDAGADEDALGTSAALDAARTRTASNDAAAGISSERLEAARAAVAGRNTQRGAPVWVRQPSADDFERLYPSRARSVSQQGQVTLACVINGEQRLECEVVSETPAGWGFGRAALGLSQRLIARPLLADGSPAEGAAFELPFDFRLTGD